MKKKGEEDGREEGREGRMEYVHNLASQLVIHFVCINLCNHKQCYVCVCEFDLPGC